MAMHETVLPDYFARKRPRDGDDFVQVNGVWMHPDDAAGRQDIPETRLLLERQPER